MIGKPILFIDFDGTLCHDRFWRSLPLDQYEKVQRLLFTEDKTCIQEWMKGKRTSEEVNLLLAEQIGISSQELWSIFVKDAETMFVSQEVLETIGKLRDIYTTILITVNMDSFSRFTVPALKLDNYFDAISNSYCEGKFKEDNGGEIFKEYLEKYNTPIKSSILMDDSPTACQTFVALGGNAHQVTLEENLAFHLNKLQLV